MDALKARNPMMPCDSCGGSGLELCAYSGEPTLCHECRGNTVVRARNERGQFTTIPYQPGGSDASPQS